MNLPNVISLGRLLSVPVAVYLIMHNFYGAAFWLFVIAGLSDAVDGFIAKRWAMSSVLGAYLDPIADKALLVAVSVALGAAGHLPSWLVILIVTRDVIIVGGVVLLHLTTQPVRMRPLMVSKINTTAQIMLVAMVLAELGSILTLGPARGLMILLVGATTVLSGGAYILSWGRQETMPGNAE